MCRALLSGFLRHLENVILFIRTQVTYGINFALRFRKVLQTILIHQNKRNHHIYIRVLKQHMPLSDQELRYSTITNFWSRAPGLDEKIFVFWSRKVLHTVPIHQNARNEHIYIQVMKQYMP